MPCSDWGNVSLKFLAKSGGWIQMQPELLNQEWKLRQKLCILYHEIHEDDIIKAFVMLRKKRKTNVKNKLT